MIVEPDHLAIGAESLEAGRAAVETALGAALETGGAHPDFGTHNLLMGLGEGIYLEVIAIDPAAPPPEGPRWFGLDELTGPPRPVGWVCRTDDLEAALDRAPAGMGAIRRLSRGPLRWRMTVPQGGVTPFDGLFPALISWETGEHPGRTLKPAGPRLATLELHSPQPRGLALALGAIVDDARIRILPAERPFIRARFDTPAGPRDL